MIIMNNINNILEIFSKYVNSRSVLEPPTKAEIIDKLCTLGVEKPGIDNSLMVDRVVASVLKSVKKYEDYFKQRNRPVNIRFLNAINGGYHLVDLYFDEDNIPGILEGINIYIPVIGDKILKIVPHIYKYLLSNRISFSSKISMFNRSDNFLVKVYSKEDAMNLINFCNNNLKNSLGIVNPFIAKIGSVGVSKEINGISYNRGIATLLNEYIEECILKQRKKAYNATDFQNFVNEKYQEADNFADKNMYYIAGVSLYCILTDDNILKYFKDEVELTFDYNNYYRYEAVNISGDYEYLYSGKVINKDTDYICWVKLQALNCLNKIYLEQYDEPFRKNTKINQRFTFKILEQLDYLLSKKGCYNLKVNYKDIEIHKLLPYLYGYIAYKYKACNVGEVKKLVDNINKSMIVKKNEEHGKIYYEQDHQKIISSIPLISTIKGAIAIDVIDHKTGMCNIFVIKRGKKDKYLSVYLSADYDLLKNNMSFEGKRYRYAVGQALLDDKRNKEALELRKSDFGSLFLNAKKEINKYLRFDND